MELVNRSVLQACGYYESLDASVAFLPSTFAMYTTMLAFSYAVYPVSMTSSRLPWTFPSASRRTLLATLLFATGAVFGWPFSILLAVPFVFEELLLRGADIIASPQTAADLQLQRLWRLVGAGLTAALLLVREPILSACERALILYRCPFLP